MTATNAALKLGVLALVAVLCLGGPLAGAAAGVQAGAGNTSIENIQQDSADGSPLAGTTVTTTGTVTAVGPEGFHIQNGTGAYSGVYVYTGGAPSVSTGDTVSVTALVKEYYDLTELDATADGASVTVTGTAPVPDPVKLDTGAAGQEAYEGVLVTVDGVTVTSTPGEYGEWAVDDGSGELAVDDVAPSDATTPAKKNATADAITGPLFYSFGAFKLQPTVVENLQAPSTGDGDGSDGGSGGDAGADTTTVTLLSYNDIQTAAAKDGNFSRLVTLVERRRAAHDNPTVVAGAGDEVGPHALSPISQWRAPTDVLNLMQPDADVVGNHEFDYGYDGVSQFTAASEFPWLSTNLVNESTGDGIQGSEEYTIVERDGVRIGFVGLVDEGATYGKTNIDFAAEGAKLEDYTEDGPATAKRLKQEENVDVVIALAHTGVPDAKDLARADDGDYIDVIAVGDDEIYYPPQQTAGSIITEGSARAAYLGELNLSVNTTENDVTNWNGHLRPVTDEIPKNETASDIINGYRAEVSLDSVITTTETPLDARFDTNYHRESGYGNLITDSFRATTGADVAITNPGGIRSNSVYGPGDITGGDVFNTLPFPNTLVTLELSGTELRETLRRQVVTLDSDTGQQYGAEVSQQVSGVRFEWIPHGDASSTIRDVWVNRAGSDEASDWEPLDEDATYEVTVNSFMAGGGSGYDNLVDQPRVAVTNTLYAEAVVDYVEPKDTIAPTREGRMRRVTADAGEADLELDGDETATLSLAVPDTATALDADSVRILNESGASVAATDADLADGILTASVPEADVGSLRTDGGDLDLYANYTDSRYADQWVYWGAAVLSAEVNATGAAPEPAPGDGTATVSVESASLSSGGEATVNVTLSAPAGFSGIDMNVSAQDRSVATVSFDTFGDDLSLTEVSGQVSPGVFLRAADVDSMIQPGATNVTLATVDVAAVGTGTTNLTVHVDRFDDETGTTTTVATAHGRVTVGPPALGRSPGGRSPTDPDGDGRYEDVNGNGRLDYDDVATLFEALDSEAVQGYPTAYDFNGNGQIDFDDVVTLYEET
ncbi:5'-nucleotidase C-terminal domain-containing protein [Halorientalis persicus]|uniref:5'-nucleotidase C-terminal domain-containing protein n=1 Tax=Halorientalis persicus TaxID=1367881 RepID=UPI001B8ACAA9|nr:5'-nucleotidase C-terminal domain-containing protein [Halorientalis persicus]